MSDLPLDTILHGDCLDVLRSLPDASVDALVTDPPYGLGAAPDMLDVLRAWLAGEVYTARGAGFMGKAWDAFVPGPEYWRECLRVLKPGGYALVFAGTRTWDVMGLALRLAGFELRDTLQWVYGSGFPKSLDVGKAIDKAAGAQREVVGKRQPFGRENRTSYSTGGNGIYGAYDTELGGVTITAPATDAARQWDGWGSALKPAWEPVILCRKPLAEPTIAANVLAHGVGALNIAQCRVAHEEPVKLTTRTSDKFSGTDYNGGNIGHYRNGDSLASASAAGRWPPNLLLSHSVWCAPDACAEGCPVRVLDRQSGVRQAGARPSRRNVSHFANGHGTQDGERIEYDTGTAARFFPQFRPTLDDAPFMYVAKASRRERNAGCEGLPEVRKGSNYGMDGARPHTKPDYHYEASARNTHPTVKPLALMSWLITLITPPGGIVLDPFAGSGSTLVAAKSGGWRYIGIEREHEYVAICEARLAATQEPSLGSAVAMEQPKPVQPAKKPRKRAPAKPAADLWESAV